MGSGLLATDYELFQSPDTQGQNIRPNRLSHIEVWNDNVLFVNASTGFSEILWYYSGTGTH